MLAPVFMLAMMQSSLPESLRGSGLYKQCLDTVKVFDNGGNVSAYEMANANLCLGYANGFLDALRIGKLGCIPEEATTGTIVRLYVNYMREHPKLMDEPEHWGMAGVIGDAYPCHPAKK